MPKNWEDHVKPAPLRDLTEDEKRAMYGPGDYIPVTVVPLDMATVLGRLEVRLSAVEGLMREILFELRELVRVTERMG